MVGMAARTRVSSVMFWLSSRGTLRSARRSTRFPSRSAAARSPTLFLAIVAAARVPCPAPDDAERQREATWIASRGSAPAFREWDSGDRSGGHAAARPARGSVAPGPAEATARRAAGRARKKEAGANADAIDKAVAAVGAGGRVLRSHGNAVNEGGGIFADRRHVNASPTGNGQRRRRQAAARHTAKTKQAQAEGKVGDWSVKNLLVLLLSPPLQQK